VIMGGASGFTVVACLLSLMELVFVASRCMFAPTTCNQYTVTTYQNARVDGLIPSFEDSFAYGSNTAAPKSSYIPDIIILKFKKMSSRRLQ
jgi:hypothetical protein